MVARMPDDGPRDFVRACEMFPGRGRSSHPTPAKGGCVPRYAPSERMPEPGVWQRKTAAAKPAAATVRDLSEEERPLPRWPGNERPAARERDSQGRAHRTGRGPTTHRARDCTGPQAPRARDWKAPRPVALQWAVREYQCEDSYS